MTLCTQKLPKCIPQNANAWAWKHVCDVALEGPAYISRQKGVSNSPAPPPPSPCPAFPPSRNSNSSEKTRCRPCFTREMVTCLQRQRRKENEETRRLTSKPGLCRWTISDWRPRNKTRKPCPLLGRRRSDELVVVKRVLIYRWARVFVEIYISFLPVDRSPPPLLAGAHGEELLPTRLSAMFLVAPLGK